MTKEHAAQGWTYSDREATYLLELRVEVEEGVTCALDTKVDLYDVLGWGGESLLTVTYDNAVKKLRGMARDRRTAGAENA